MEKHRSRRPSTPTVLSMLAVIIATWGVFVQPSGAGGSQEIIKVLAKASYCQAGGADICAFMGANSVSAAALQNNSVDLKAMLDNAVSQKEIANNAVSEKEIEDKGIKGRDIDKILLRSIDKVFPTLVATASETEPSAPGNVGTYMGDGGANPLDPLARNYDAVVGNPDTWGPCVGQGSAATFPCFKVPADGTYLLTIRVIWQNNTTDDRLVVVDEWGTNCDQEGANGYRSLIADWAAAEDLPFDLNTSGRIQQYTVVAELEKDDCIGTIFRQDSGTDLTFDVVFTAAMQ